MESLAALLVALAVVAVVLALVYLTSGLHQRAWRHTVIVNTKDDHSIRGVLVRVHRDALEISAAQAITDDGREQLPGVVLVPRGNVSTIQRAE